MKIQTIGDYMVAEIDEVREAQVVRVQPGDLLVLVSDDYLTEKAIANIREHLTPALPDGVNLAVIERSHFEVIRSEEDSE